MTERKTPEEIIKGLEGLLFAAYLTGKSEGRSFISWYTENKKEDVLREHLKDYAQQETLLLQEEIERLKNDLLDALDLKKGEGPTALSNVVADRNRLQTELTKAKERIKELEVLLNKIHLYDYSHLCEHRVSAITVELSDAIKSSLNNSGK